MYWLNKSSEWHNWVYIVLNYLYQNLDPWSSVGLTDRTLFSYLSWEYLQKMLQDTQCNSTLTWWPSQAGGALSSPLDTGGLRSGGGKKGGRGRKGNQGSTSPPWEDSSSGSCERNDAGTSLISEASLVHRGVDVVPNSFGIDPGTSNRVTQLKHSCGYGWVLGIELLI